MKIFSLSRVAILAAALFAAEGKAELENVFGPEDREEIRAYLLQEDYVSARKAMLPLAEAGDPNSQWGLGLIYQRGLGVEQSDSEAFKWFKKSAEGGFVDAQFSLATAYFTGEGAEVDVDEAHRWLMAAAEQGHVEAQYQLGHRMIYAEERFEDLERGEYWLTSAAYSGNADAQYDLARYYDYEAKYLVDALVNGELSEPESQKELLRVGRSVLGVIDRAVYWYEKAAAQGLGNAEPGVTFMNRLRERHIEWEATVWQKL